MDQLEDDELRKVSGEAQSAVGRLTFGDALTLYREHLEFEGIRPKTREFREAGIKLALRSWPGIEEVNTRKITARAVEEWLRRFYSQAKSHVPKNAKSPAKNSTGATRGVNRAWSKKSVSTRGRLFLPVRCQSPRPWKAAFWRDWNRPVSGSDHRENHLEPPERLEGVRLTCWHENYFAAPQAVWVAGNHNFCFAFHHLHQCVERGRVFAQSLSFVEGENRHAAGGLLDDLAAHNGTVLVADEFSDLGRLDTRESFG